MFNWFYMTFFVPVRMLIHRLRDREFYSVDPGLWSDEHEKSGAGECDHAECTMMRYNSQNAHGSRYKDDPRMRKLLRCKPFIELTNAIVILGAPMPALGVIYTESIAASITAAGRAILDGYKPRTVIDLREKALEYGERPDFKAFVNPVDDHNTDFIASCGFTVFEMVRHGFSPATIAAAVMAIDLLFEDGANYKPPVEVDPRAERGSAILAQHFADDDALFAFED